jgi:hypothetical protein
MALKAKFNSEDIRKRGEIIERVLDDYIFQVLSFVGESFVRLARSISTYIDRTGNLRSSIGYIIILNGKIKKEDFEGTGEGIEKGKEHALTLSSNHRWVFVGVAGEDYASAVESRGLDVITGSSEAAKQLLERLLRKAKQRLLKK